MKFTVKDVRSAYSDEKREKELRQNLIGFLVYRQISFYLTLLFLQLNISANSVTNFTLIFISSLPFVAIHAGQHAYILIALLCFIYHCFDYADGNIARVTKTTSKYGIYMDSLLGNLYWTSLYVSIGILVDKIVPVTSFFYKKGVIIGLISSILRILSKISRLYYKHYIERETKDSSFIKEPGHLIMKLAISVIPSAAYLVVPLMLITGYLKHLSITLVFCFSFELLIFIYSQYHIIKNLKKP
jgi:phosphatidylglycerophosphate synthase